jgi:predicted metalloprotease with PDZ domain
MPAHVRRTVFLLLLFLALAPRVSAQAPTVKTATYSIAYRLSMTEPKSHLFEVQIDVEGLSGADHVDFQMPRWSPGRYAVFDFAKNVQEVRAMGACRPQERCGSKGYPVERLDTQTWRVVGPDLSRISLTYSVFADDLSGTFSQLDERHASFNGGSVFMYVVGHKPDPVSLKVGAPHGWRVVNGYSTREDQTEFQFPNYDILIDTPTEVGPDWTMQEFKVDGKTYRVVVHSFGEEGGKRAALVRDVERLVRAETRMMGAPDFESYTFLFHFDPTAARGDGMEHLTSTQIVETGALADGGVYESAVDTAAHEFFHVWNVKRLRPVELGPWDFTRPLVTRSLWIAEGFTNYYGKLFERRSGIWTDEQLLSSYAGAVGGIESAQGSRLMSAEESSLLAPFLDRSTSEQRTNLSNTSISYYPKGETLALVLDLLIRGRTAGRRSLDDVMRRMYEEFYLKSPQATYYLRGRGYTIEDFERVASEVSGTDLSDFFARHVRSAQPPPYDEALAAVGLRLVRAPARMPFSAGITHDARNSESVRISSIATGSGAERAGLKQGDVLLRIGKREVTPRTWLEALNAFKAGERVSVSARRADRSVSTFITLPAAPERYEYRIEADEKAPAQARSLREAWLTDKR